MTGVVRPRYRSKRWDAVQMFHVMQCPLQPPAHTPWQRTRPLPYSRDVLASCVSSSFGSDMHSVWLLSWTWYADHKQRDT